MGKPQIDARVGPVWTIPFTLASSAGCGGSTATPAAITWEVRGESGGVAVGAGEYGTASAGDNKLGVGNGRLTANGGDGGEVKAGDKVVLDKDGQLYVNGVKRETRPADRR